MFLAGALNIQIINILFTNKDCTWYIEKVVTLENIYKATNTPNKNPHISVKVSAVGTI